MSLALLLRVGPWVALLAAAGWIAVLLGRLDHVQMQAKVDVGSAQLASARHDLDQANRTTAAVSTYADRTAALQPIVVRSTDTVTRYAETPAGRATCAAPERVSGIDALDASLWPPAGRSAGPVPADAGSPSARRISDQR